MSAPDLTLPTCLACNRGVVELAQGPQICAVCRGDAHTQLANNAIFEAVRKAVYQTLRWPLNHKPSNRDLTPASPPRWMYIHPDLRARLRDRKNKEWKLVNTQEAV